MRLHCGLVFMFTGLVLAEAPPRVVTEIDLERYQGTWYEIARFPNRFQRVCAGDVTAKYSLEDDGKIEVVNQCRKQEGSLVTANGVAKRTAEPAKLKVRFAPAFLAFLPFVWADYWIVDLAKDYSYAVVGSPDRKYLWILSRERVMDQSLYELIEGRLESEGFQVDQLVKTTQTVRPGGSPVKE